MRLNSFFVQLIPSLKVLFLQFSLIVVINLLNSFKTIGFPSEKFSVQESHNVLPELRFQD